MKTDSRMFATNCVHHFVEVRTTEVRERLEAGEDTATRHSLEMFFTDVLQTSSQQWHCSLKARFPP